MQRIAIAGGEVYVSTIKQIRGPNGHMVLQKVDKILTNSNTDSLN